MGSCWFLSDYSSSFSQPILLAVCWTGERLEGSEMERIEFHLVPYLLHIISFLFSSTMHTVQRNLPLLCNSPLGLMGTLRTCKKPCMPQILLVIINVCFTFHKCVNMAKANVGYYLHRATLHPVLVHVQGWCLLCDLSCRRAQAASTDHWEPRFSCFMYIACVSQSHSKYSAGCSGYHICLTYSWYPVWLGLNFIVFLCDLGLCLSPKKTGFRCSFLFAYLFHCLLVFV